MATLQTEVDVHDRIEARGNWQVLEEVSTLLTAAGAEASLAIKDGSRSVNTLAGTFTKMVRDVLEMKLASNELRALDREAHQRLLETCEACLDKAQEAVVGFQFYDKLVQRLDHIAESLKHISAALGDEQCTSGETWERVRNRIHGSFNIEEDRALFLAILDGMPVDQALHASRRHRVEAAEEKVELF